VVLNQGCGALGVGGSGVVIRLAWVRCDRAGYGWMISIGGFRWAHFGKFCFKRCVKSDVERIMSDSLRSFTSVRSALSKEIWSKKNERNRITSSHIKHIQHRCTCFPSSRVHTSGRGWDRSWINLGSPVNRVY